MIYETGGIGKSTATQNLTVYLAELSKNIMAVGCGSKAGVECAGRGIITSIGMFEE